MNLWAIQQNAFSPMEEMEQLCFISSLGRKTYRLSKTSYHTEAELCDSITGTGLLDILLLKGGCGSDLVPPFLCGSPPSRVANPLIQDARFGDEKLSSFLPLSTIPPMCGHSLSSPHARKGGCVMSNFGNNPSVRVDGFDCLKRDRGNCSIPALA